MKVLHKVQETQRQDFAKYKPLHYMMKEISKVETQWILLQAAQSKKALEEQLKKIKKRKED